MPDYRRWFLRTAVAAIVAIVVLGVTVIVLFVLNRDKSALYVIAQGVTEGSTSERGAPLDVDVWIDKELWFSHISGDNIPIISLRPGRYELRVEARGYCPYVERIVALPSGGGEIYVYAGLHRSTGRRAPKR